MDKYNQDVLDRAQQVIEGLKTRAEAEVKRIQAGLEAESQSRAQAMARAKSATAGLETDSPSHLQQSIDEVALVVRIAELEAKGSELGVLVNRADEVLSELGGE